MWEPKLYMVSHPYASQQSSHMNLPMNLPSLRCKSAALYNARGACSAQGKRDDSEKVWLKDVRPE